MGLKENIKKYRKEKKLTQQQFGEKINKSESTIRKYEKGDVLPPLSVVNEIANFLQIEVTDLFEGENDSQILNNMTSNLNTNDDKEDKLNKYKEYAIKDKFLYYDKMNPKELEEMYLMKIKSLENANKTLESLITLHEIQYKMLNEVLPNDFWDTDKVDNYIEIIKKAFNK